MVLRKFTIVAGILLGAIILIACGYLTYLGFNSYRIGDTSLEVEGDATYTTAHTGTTYSISTLNLGFGAYQQNFSGTLDTGYVQDSSGDWDIGTGKHIKALSESNVKVNTSGSADVLKSLSTDFVLTQEVDTNSNRSFNVNQKEMLQSAFGGYASAYAVDNHTPFIVYPFTDMEGVVNSGLLTLSRYSIKSADRHELAVPEDVLAKSYELDRCFSASYVDVDNGKQLVLVNVHLSPYESGDSVREQQRKLLYSFISEQYAKGNYVVVGGTFNHDLLTNNPDYPEYTSDAPAFSTTYTEKTQYCATWFNESGSAGLPDGFKVTASDNWPSCRNAATNWTQGFNQTYTLDGFITSENVRIVSHKNVETDSPNANGFAYSDHEPAYLEFELE